MEQGVMLAHEYFAVGFLGGKREIASNWNCHKILIKTNVDVEARILWITYLNKVIINWASDARIWQRLKEQILLWAEWMEL